MKKLFGILAYPAKHSLSPTIYNGLFKDLGIDAEYVFFETKPEDLRKFIDQVRDEGIDGFAVSLPFKEVIMQYLNKIDEEAEKVGAVNTVVNKNGFLYGYNTDVVGTVGALKEAFGELKNKTFVFLGAGGASRAGVYALLKEGAKVIIQNRSRSNAEKIQKDFAQFFDRNIAVADWGDFCEGDILINATSIWFTQKDFDQNSLPFFCQSSYLKNFKGVMDMSYGAIFEAFENNEIDEKLTTPFIWVADRLGIKFVTGDKMLLHQCKKQLEIWTRD